MNSDVMHSIVQMEPTILRKLMEEVKETVATDVEYAKEVKSSFGALDLYKIRRNRKPQGSLRKGGNIVTGLSY